VKRRIVVGLIAAGLCAGSAVAITQGTDDPVVPASATTITDPVVAAEVEQTLAGMAADAEATASKQDDAR